MRTFLIRVLFFVLLLLVVNGVIGLFAPYYYGNPWYTAKINYLDSLDGEHNLYFFGSSRVYRQINPSVFDSVVNNKVAGSKVKSFNMGAPATFNPQLYHLYQNFLDSDLAEEVDYCILEMTSFDYISDKLLHQERVNYWLGYKELLDAFEYITLNRSYSLRQKVTAIRHYLVSYFEAIFHLGHFGQQFIQKEYYSKDFLGKEFNGFYPLESEYSFTNDKSFKVHLKERLELLREKPDMLEKRKNKAVALYESEIDSELFDQFHYNKLISMISLSEKRGIKLILINSPRTMSESIKLIIDSLPKSNVIDLANPNLFHFAYEENLSFDVGHLNTEGADIYTDTLARVFVQSNY